MRSIKSSDGWKLIEYNVLGKEVCESQLFNLTANPHELIDEHHCPVIAPQVEAKQGRSLGDEQRNLAYHPDYQAKRKEMASLLAYEMKRLGDPYDLKGTYSKEMPKRPNQRKKPPKKTSRSGRAVH